MCLSLPIDFYINRIFWIESTDVYFINIETKNFNIMNHEKISINNR